MSGYFRTTMIASAALLALSGGAWAQSVVIGHFGNPTPMQVAASEG